eukprot:2109_1
MTVSQIFRCFTFLSTSLPGPSPHCKSDSKDYNPPLNWKDILFRVDYIGGCGDLIYSGHVAIIIGFTMVTIHYSHMLFPDDKIQKRYIWIKYIIFTALILSVLMFDVFILAARNHYTVDVVVASYWIPALYYVLWNVFPDVAYVENVDNHLLNQTGIDNNVLDSDNNDKVFVTLSDH